MGMTSIQVSLSNFVKALKEMANYEYLGKVYFNCSHVPTWKRCMPRNMRNNRPSIKQFIEFKKMLDVYHKEKTNVLLVEEEFSRQIMESRSRDILQIVYDVKEEWEIVLIVSYRRYFEWIVSSYNQVTKVKKIG